MYGRSVYDIWLLKYGKIEAERLLNNLKEKHRTNSTGANNPMYGKKTPEGSGNGWSGWYKNKLFFRSLKELSYAYNLDKDGIPWQSAEFVKITYTDFNNVLRTYRPDFLVDDKLLVEIKPKSLHKSVAVRSKMNAAIAYCVDTKWTYQLLDQEPLDINTIRGLYECKDIKFLDRYEKLFHEKYALEDKTK